VKSGRQGCSKMGVFGDYLGLIGRRQAWWVFDIGYVHLSPPRWNLRILCGF
jgi:hypothetical protein